jgi:hypothetical protein
MTVESAYAVVMGLGEYEVRTVHGCSGVVAYLRACKGSINGASMSQGALMRQVRLLPTAAV